MSHSGVVRHAVRVLLIDDANRVLLFRAHDPSTGAGFWFPPGGGLRTTSFDPDLRGVTENEKADLAGWRWWTLRELQSTTDQLTPRQLPRHLRDLLRDGPPPTPIDVGV